MVHIAICQQSIGQKCMGSRTLLMLKYDDPPHKRSNKKVLDIYVL